MATNQNYAVSTNRQNESRLLAAWPSKEEVYTLAANLSYCDMLSASLTNQVIHNTIFLANSAMEGINAFPEFKDTFIKEVRSYAEEAMENIRGGGYND